MNSFVRLFVLSGPLSCCIACCLRRRPRHSLTQRLRNTTISILIRATVLHAMRKSVPCRRVQSTTTGTIDAHSRSDQAHRSGLASAIVAITSIGVRGSPRNRRAGSSPHEDVDHSRTQPRGRHTRSRIQPLGLPIMSTSGVAEVQIALVDCAQATGSLPDPVGQ